MTRYAQGVLWVCVECLMAREADDTEEYPNAWSREPDIDVTLGQLYEAHDCDDPTSGICSCDHRNFSTSRCDGCGSHVAGERFAYTWWTDYKGIGNDPTHPSWDAKY